MCTACLASVYQQRDSSAPFNHHYQHVVLEVLQKWRMVFNFLSRHYDRSPSSTRLGHRAQRDSLLESHLSVSPSTQSVFFMLSLSFAFVPPCVVCQLPWDNFRLSHSDGKPYGDLDPRFLDEVNSGENPFRNIAGSVGTFERL